MDHRIKLARDHFGIVNPTDWQEIRPEWIIETSSGSWWWCETDPDDETCCGLRCLIYRDGKPTVGDFTPPPCDDWRTSKRRIGGAE